MDHIVADVAAEGRARFKPLTEAVAVNVGHRSFTVAWLDQRKLISVTESARQVCFVTRIRYHSGLRIDNDVVVCFCGSVLACVLTLSEIA